MYKKVCCMGKVVFLLARPVVVKVTVVFLLFSMPSLFSIT